MDYYTGLALYVDALYGTSALVAAMQDTRSASSLTFPHASDFLAGVERALRGESEITLALPDLSDMANENTIRFFLPAGVWNVETQSSVLSWRIPAGTAAGITRTSKVVTARKAGWCALTYARVPDASVHARLSFRKRE